MGASYFVLFLTFLVAYSDPRKKVLITINTCGEANLELLVLTLALPFIISGMKENLDGIRN